MTGTSLLKKIPLSSLKSDNVFGQKSTISKMTGKLGSGNYESEKSNIVFPFGRSANEIKVPEVRAKSINKESEKCHNPFKNVFNKEISPFKLSLRESKQK